MPGFYFFINVFIVFLFKNKFNSNSLANDLGQRKCSSVLLLISLSKRINTMSFDPREGSAAHPELLEQAFLPTFGCFVARVFFP